MSESAALELEIRRSHAITAEEVNSRELIEQWCATVRRKDYDGVLRRHSANILVFDVPEPFQSEGLDAYRKTWDLFFSCNVEPVTFHFADKIIEHERHLVPAP